VAILEFSKPRHWLFGRAYRFYFRHLLPRVGQWFSRSPDAAYHYLPASVLEFPDYDDLLARMRRHGLGKCRYQTLTFGIATLYVGTKE
jgi:demethylmenaquinone methyltransferase/2-methoxy-6-polyprenyl-1,4-benzoquinol methylase